MSEDQVRELTVTELTDLIAELSVKLSSLEQAKKDYVSTLSEIIKINKKQFNLAVEVLSAKDPEMARRMHIEVRNIIPRG